MDISLLILGFALFIILTIYVLMCGNNKFHRSGIIGACYRFIIDTIPAAFALVTEKLCPQRSSGKEKPKCCGPKGPCRSFIFMFYACLYIYFIVIYFRRIYPHHYNIYPSHRYLHKIIPFVVAAFPWIITAVLQWYDPGRITRENVNSYLAIYKPDGVIYHEGVCRTLRIPIVARSRFCRFTNQRIAYV
jgi:hypothetical protein